MKARSLPPTGRRPQSGPAAGRGPIESTPAAPFAAWEEWFRRAPAGPRSEILALADRQGFLSLHQLPPLRDVPQRDALPGIPESGFLHQLIAGQTADLPFIPAPRVNEPARAAVDRLRATTDICLWRRRPGNDAAATLLAQVLRQAVDEAQRVLYVGPSLGSLERVLEKVAECPSFLAVRFVGNSEKAANGPLTRFGLIEQRQSLRSRLLSEAEKARSDADHARQRREPEQAVWPALTELVARRPALVRQRDALSARLAAIEDEVRREAQSLRSSDRLFPSGPFAVDFAHRLSAHQHRKAATESRLQELLRHADAFSVRLEDLRSRRRPLESLAQARAAGRWWTLGYWQAAWHAADLAEDVELEEQEHTARAESERIRTEIIAAQESLAVDHERINSEANELADAEISRRRSELNQQLAEANANLATVDESWTARLDALHDPADRPTDRTVDAIAAAQERWSHRQSTEESGRSFVAEWSRYLAEGIDALLDRLPGLAPVLVGTTAALVDNADFAAAVTGGDFDLVVIDDADGLAEPELSRLTGLAPRSLLVGAADPVDATTCPTRATPFQKLWHLLHPSGTRPTYTWSTSEGSVACTLHRLDAADAAFVETERLADFPEIELRILARPNTLPKLAQVVFPATMPLAEVKTFIYRELQESAVDRLDRPGRWEETATSYVLHLADEHAHEFASVELEPGLVESVCPDGNDWTTCRLTFAKAAGWTCARVQEWCRRYLGFVDTGRTADLG